MADSAVQLEHDDFCRAFLSPSTQKSPVWLQSQVKLHALGDPDTHTEEELFELFVSVIIAYQSPY